MKKNIYYSILFLFFIFVFTVFYLGLDKPNFYKPNEFDNKNLTTFTSKELFLNNEFNSNDIIDPSYKWHEIDINDFESTGLIQHCFNSILD